MTDGAVSELSASVVIVTHNRKELLRTALISATTQHGAPEVIVMDDRSTDGTPDMVREEFHAVRYVRSKAPSGYIVLRNEAARLATSDVIVSIDDDARFSSDDAVATTLEELADRRVGAVAMPLIHTARGSEVLQRPPSPDGVWVTNAYIGTAHAVRRDLFLELGGYREELEHFFEEPDFCIRLLRAGFVVRLGRASPILHEESLKRNVGRGVHYFSRNHLLFTWTYVPVPHVVPRLLAVAVHGVWFGIRLRQPLAAARGVLAGGREISRRRYERAPVPITLYRRWRTLRRRPAPLAPADALTST